MYLPGLNFYWSTCSYHKNLLAKGRELKIVNPLDPAKSLFHLTGITKVLNTFEAASDAVKSFTNRITAV